MPSTKLNKAGRDLVIERILAGDSDKEIRAALKAAGHPVIVQQSIAWHRSRREVQEIIAERQKHLRQIALGDRSRRLDKLNAAAKRLERRLMRNGELDDADAVDNLKSSLFHLDRYFACLQDIRREVGDDKTVVEHRADEDNALMILRRMLAGPEAKDG